MRQNIYPTQLFIRRKGRTAAPSPGGDDIINSSSVKNAIDMSINNMRHSITMSNSDGTSYINKGISIKPYKIHYIDDGEYLTNRSLYCVYEITFPAISDGDSITSVVMDDIQLGNTFFVGSKLPAVIGKIDIHEKGYKDGWRIEETAGAIKYYNYTPNFENKEWSILFPEHIPMAVLYNMIPNNTWGYNYDGIARDFNDIMRSIPASIRPFNLITNLTNLNYIQTFSPEYGSGKAVTIYYDKYLIGMPTPV